MSGFSSMRSSFSIFSKDPCVLSSMVGVRIFDLYEVGRLNCQLFFVSDLK